MPRGRPCASVRSRAGIDARNGNRRGRPGTAREPASMPPGPSSAGSPSSRAPEVERVAVVVHVHARHGDGRHARRGRAGPETCASVVRPAGSPAIGPAASSAADGAPAAPPAAPPSIVGHAACAAAARGGRLRRRGRTAFLHGKRGRRRLLGGARRVRLRGSARVERVRAKGPPRARPAPPRRRKRRRPRRRRPKRLPRPRRCARKEGSRIRCSTSPRLCFRNGSLDSSCRQLSRVVVPRPL